MSAPRIRRHQDGSFWIPRPDRELEHQLNRLRVRVPGALRWFPRGYNKELSDYEDKHVDTKAWIIGKGPSLDFLKKDDLDGGVVICVNDSIKKINELEVDQPVYVIQQDSNLREECRPTNTDHILIVNRGSKGWYADYRNRVPITPQALGVNHAGPTVILAIVIAKFLGCKEICFVSFDAATDLNCDYAKIIGHLSTEGGNPNRFLGHKKIILHKADEYKLFVEWFTPSEASDDKPQQLQEHPPTPDGISLSSHSVECKGTEDSA